MLGAWRVDQVIDMVVEWIEKSKCRISAKRLLPIAPRPARGLGAEASPYQYGRAASRSSRGAATVRVGACCPPFKQ